MVKVQTVRGFINQRLSAAAEEIFELFERTIAEYEEQLCRSKEENERQKKLLEAVYNPEVRLHGADIQQLLVNTEEEPEKSPSLDQKDPPKTPHVKEEDEANWALEFTPVCVKTEDDDVEEAETSPLHQENRDESLQSSESDSCLNSESGLNPEQVRDESDFKITSGPPAGSSAHPTSSDRKEQPLKHEGNKESSKLYSCSVCKKTFSWKASLDKHVLVHTREKPSTCTVSNTRFYRPEEPYPIGAIYQREEDRETEGLKTVDECYLCSVCGLKIRTEKRFRAHVKRHAEKNHFSRSVCPKTYPSKLELVEKPLSCPVCAERFPSQTKLKLHSCVHPGEREEELWTQVQLGEPVEAEVVQSTQASVPVQREDDEGETAPAEDREGLRTEAGGDSKPDGDDDPGVYCETTVFISDSEEIDEAQSGFNPAREKLNVTSSVPAEKHQTQSRAQKGDRRYPCPVCGKKLRSEKYLLKVHMKLHTERNSFSCSVCKINYLTKAGLAIHQRTHSKFTEPSELQRHESEQFSSLEARREHVAVLKKKKKQTFGCTVCGKTFKACGLLKRHMMVHRDALDPQGSVFE